MNEQSTNAWEAELQQAQNAYAQKRYGDARAHLAAARRNGAFGKATKRLERAIAADEQDQRKRGSNSGWVGFFGAALAYLFLFFIPLSSVVHKVVALLIVPACCGWVIGRMMGFDAGARERFRRGAKMAGYAMFWYAIVSLIWLRTRYPMGAETGQVFWLWLMVSLAYGVAAALVAGTVSAKLTWLGAKETSHGSAS